MQKIPIQLADTGMKLAKDVYIGSTPTGAPICGNGTVLTDAMITRLKKIGISVLYVEGPPLFIEDQPSPDDLLHDLDDRFAKTKQEPLNALLYDIIKKSLFESMGDD